MPIRRHFLNPARAALPQVAAWLIDRSLLGKMADLSRLIVVLPSSRAGRRLDELLVDLAQTRSLTLLPPTLTTEGLAPEMLYRPLHPFANPLTQRLAWAESLRRFPRQRLGQTISQLPEDADHEGWESLAELLRLQHIELAADGLDFSDVVKATAELGEQYEQERWTILREVQEKYLLALDAEKLWDRQTARIVAIERNECSTERDIVLVGTVDLNISFRKMLDAVSERVTSLVHASLDWADQFDKYGCLIASAWQDREIQLSDDQIAVVDGPAEQAEAVLQSISEFDGHYRADEISIGLADDRLVHPVKRSLSQHHLPHRWGAGQLFVELAPYRLLREIATFVASSRFSDLATLVRHPEIDCFLSREGIDRDCLTRLDDYQSNHLPLRVGRKQLGGEHLTKMLQSIRQWLQPLAGSARPLADWMAPIEQVLYSIYADHDWSRANSQGHEEVPFFRKLSKAIDAMAEIPPSLSPPIAAPRAIELLLEQIATERIPDEVNPAAIEMLGWLELALDDAPALIVAGLNEGLVPKSTGGDAFLPNALRSRLGLIDDARRYARDAYALGIVLQSRPKVSIVVGRRDEQKNPLLPSRLLFAAKPETVARRAIAIFDQGESVGNPWKTIVADSPTEDLFGFDIPRPVAPEKRIERLRVTAFRSYLACPYRFYLEHVLGLKQRDDHAVELDGAAFGNMLHAVLQTFGQAEAVRDSTEEEEIATFLDTALAEYAASQFSDNTTPAVAVQVEQARLRLRAFAGCQADWASKGWRIQHAESDAEAEFEVDGEPMTIRGRIDRVDYHAKNDQWAVLDYKSGDTPTPPEKAHRKKGEWVDLQLPLYRKLVSQLDVPASAALGYIVLPRDTKKVEFLLANWNDEELNEAEAAAREVVRGIRNDRYWPPAQEPPPFSESLGWICLDNIFDRPDLTANSEGLQP